jgi:hypothetical protein
MAATVLAKPGGVDRQVEGPFETVKERVHPRVLTPVLDLAAGMPRRGSIAAEQPPGRSMGQAQSGMGKVHRDLTRKRSFGAAAPIRPDRIDAKTKGGGDQRPQHLP